MEKISIKELHAVEIALEKIKKLTPTDKAELFKRIGEVAPRYIKIMQFQGDISKDLNSQTIFNGFYQVRRNLQWRTLFYIFFQKLRLDNKRDLTLEKILCHLHDSFGKWEYSFSTKMLHTLDDTQPIIDSKVLKFLDIPVRGKKELQKILEHYGIYLKITHILLNKIEVKKILDEFDQKLPNLSKISEVKKLDFILWKFKG